MSSYRPRPPQFPFAPRPNEYPPTLIPLEPPMPPHLQPPMPRRWGYGVGQMAHNSQNYTQNPPYRYQSPPPPPSMFYHHSQYFTFNPQLPPIFPPLPLTPHPSTLMIPPPPPDFPCPPPPPPPEYPYPAPPPPPELPCVPSPTPLKNDRTKVETLKRFENHELENSNHGKPPKHQMRKTHGDYKDMVHLSNIGRSRMSERTTPLWSRIKIENRLKKPTSFVCKMKFRNELPDITRECKILPLKRGICCFSQGTRYTKYNAAAEKRLWKPQIHPEANLGIPLDLLDMSVYNPSKGERMPLDPEDEELMRDDDDDDVAVALTPALKNNGLKRKSRPDDQNVSWLVKTQYISPVNTKAAKQPVTKRGVEMPQRLGARNNLENLYDRESRIRKIEASFEACKSLPVHATNKELQPVEVLPLLPDFDRFNNQFVAATFDSDPTGDSETYNRLDKSVREACESMAIMKSCVVKDSESVDMERFLAYLAPLPNEMSKGMNNEEDISYSRVREYYYNVQGDDADDPKSYIVSLNNNEARYVPLPTKLKMRKKKASKGTASHVVVRRRPTEETVVPESGQE